MAVLKLVPGFKGGGSAGHASDWLVLSGARGGRGGDFLFPVGHCVGVCVESEIARHTACSTQHRK